MEMEKHKGKKKEPAAQQVKLTPEQKAAEKLAALCRKEGGKKGQDIAGMASFGVSFFAVTIESAEGRMDLLEECMIGMNAEVDPEAEDRKGGAGDLGKILFNASDTTMCVYCHSPVETMERATVAEWMAGVIEATGATITFQDEHFIKAELAANPEKGVFTLKLRDEGINAAFTFLRSRSLVIEDDEEEEVWTAEGVNLGATDY